MVTELLPNARPANPPASLIAGTGYQRTSVHSARYVGAVLDVQCCNARGHILQALEVKDLLLMGSVTA